MKKLAKSWPLKSSTEVNKVNIYEETLVQKGYTLAELRRPVARPEVPEHLRDIYATYDDYREALHDFLNGN